MTPDEIKLSFQCEARIESCPRCKYFVSRYDDEVTCSSEAKAMEIAELINEPKVLDEFIQSGSIEILDPFYCDEECACFSRKNTLRLLAEIQEVHPTTSMNYNQVSSD